MVIKSTAEVPPTQEDGNLKAGIVPVVASEDGEQTALSSSDKETHAVAANEASGSEQEAPTKDVETTTETSSEQLPVSADQRTTTAVTDESSTVETAAARVEDAPEQLAQEPAVELVEDPNGTAREPEVASSEPSKEATPSPVKTPSSVEDPAPVQDSSPISSDENTKPVDVEQAIPATTELPPPEAPPIAAKDLDIEQGIPPDTPPVKDSDKTDTDDGDTELGDSFETGKPVVDGEDDVSSKNPHRRRNHFIFGTLIVVIILGAVLGILFGTGVTGPRSTESDQAQAGPQGDSTSTDAPPTMSSGGDAPAPAPTNSDAAQPTEGSAQQPTEAAVEEDDLLLDALRVYSPGGALDDPTSAQYQAYLWMKNEDELMSEVMTEPAKLQQRYALATVYMALKGSVPSIYASRGECQWPTVSCGTHNATNLFGAWDWQVTEINMARQVLSGNIPGEIGLLAQSLVSLDFGENNISGSLPDELYQLVNLKYLYLHDNAIGGTLSEDIGNMQLLEEVYLGSNQIGGTIPYNIGSRTAVRRPLRFLILYNNEFEGPIPNDMQLSTMFHMDLSFNKLNGTLPADIGERFPRLRQLYLDNNAFTGSIPESYAQAGGGRLYVLTLNDNELTGGVPTGWDKDNLFIDTINVQNNLLTEPIDKSICKFSALVSGELVELGADCDICTCDVLCDKCY